MTNTSWYKSRDKYGRTNYELSGREGRLAAIIVVLPRGWVEANPGVGRYMVALRVLPMEWNADGRRVENPLQGTHHASLSGAKIWTETTLRELLDIPADLDYASRDQLQVARRNAGYDIQKHQARLDVLDRVGVESDSVARVEPTEDLAHARNRLADVEWHISERDASQLRVSTRV